MATVLKSVAAVRGLRT